MKFGSAPGIVRKIIAPDMPGLKRDAGKAVEFTDSKPPDRPNQPASANRLRQHGHSPSLAFKGPRTRWAAQHQSVRVSGEGPSVVPEVGTLPQDVLLEDEDPLLAGPDASGVLAGRHPLLLVFEDGDV